MPTAPAPRGVFRAPAPAGFVSYHAIDSRGHELALIRLPEPTFDPSLIIRLWDILEAGDPLPDAVRLAALLRAAFPRGWGKGCVRRPRKP